MKMQPTMHDDIADLLCNLKADLAVVNARPVHYEHDCEHVSGGEESDDNVDLAMTSWSPSASLAHLSHFCAGQQLKHLTLDALLSANLLNQLHALIYHTSRHLVRRSCSAEQATAAGDEYASLLDCLDAIYDQLTEANSTRPIAMQSVHLFLLASMSCVLRLLSSSSSSTIADVWPLASLMRKVQSILSKLAKLVESEHLQGLTTTTTTNANCTPVSTLSLAAFGHAHLLKLIFYLVGIVGQLNETRSILAVWRCLSKLVVKNRLLLSSTSGSTFSQHSQQQQQQQQLLVSVFTRLDAQLVNNLELVRDSLLKMRQATSSSGGGGGSSQVQTASGTQSMSTQSGVAADHVQNTQKMIKLSGFLFKIYRSIVAAYSHMLMLTTAQAALDDDGNGDEHAPFDSIVGVIGLVTHIALISPVSLDTIDMWLAVDDNDNGKSNSNALLQRVGKQFAMLKQEFVKEFAPGADTLLKHLESEPRFAAYLLLDAHGKKHTRRIVRMSNQQTTQPPVVASGGVEALQHRAVQRFLFLAIYLNRCELSAAEGSVSSATACLNALFNALELCAQAVNLPTHLSMSDAFLATFVFADACHTQSNASSNNNTTTTLELYDFGVLSASRLLVRLAALASLSACKKTGDSKASTTSIVAFLAANLLMTRSGLGPLSNCDDLKLGDLNGTTSDTILYRLHPLRAQLAHDLLLFIAYRLAGHHHQQSQNPGGPPTSSHHHHHPLVHFAKFLCDTFEFYSSLNGADYRLTSLLHSLLDLRHLVLAVCRSHLRPSQLDALVEHVRSQRHLHCYALLAATCRRRLAPSATARLKQIDVFHTNTLAKLADCYGELQAALTKRPGDTQAWIKRVALVVDNTRMQSYLDMALSLYDTATESAYSGGGGGEHDASGARKELNETPPVASARRALAKRLLALIQHAELDKLLKHLHDEASISCGGGGKLKASTLNAAQLAQHNKLFTFVCRSVELHGLLMASAAKYETEADEDSDSTDTNNEATNVDVSHVLSFLAKNVALFATSPSTSRQIGAFATTLRCHSAHYLQCVSLVRCEAETRRRVVELFVLLVADGSFVEHEANAALSFLTLECLNGFLQTPHEDNSKVIVEVRRQCSAERRRLIDNYIQHTSSCLSQQSTTAAAARDELLRARFVASLQAVTERLCAARKNEFKTPMSVDEMHDDVEAAEDDADEEQQQNANDDNMNDMNSTMSVLMSAASAMDMTVCGKANGDDDGNSEEAIDDEELANRVTKDIGKLLEAYERRSRPAWFRRRLQHMSQLLTRI